GWILRSSAVASLSAAASCLAGARLTSDTSVDAASDAVVSPAATGAGCRIQNANQSAAGAAATASPASSTVREEERRAAKAAKGAKRMGRNLKRSVQASTRGTRVTTSERRRATERRPN